MLLIDAFIACYLLFATLWDAPEQNLIHGWIRAWLRPRVRALGVAFAWDLYYGPFLVCHELRIRSTDARGLTKTVKPAPRYEFRRYAFMLACENRADLFCAYLAYVASTLPAQYVRPVDLVAVRRTCRRRGRSGGWRGRYQLRDEKEFEEKIVARLRVEA